MSDVNDGLRPLTERPSGSGKMTSPVYATHVSFGIREEIRSRMMRIDVIRDVRCAGRTCGSSRSESDPVPDTSPAT